MLQDPDHDEQSTEQEHIQCAMNVLRRRLGVSSIGASVWLVLQMVRVIPPGFSTQVLAVALVISGTAHSLRIVAHLSDGYVSRKPGAARKLAWLVLLDAGLTGVWIGTGIYTLFEPNPLLQGLVCAFLVFAVPMVAAWTVVTARAAKKTRGTEYLRKLIWVKRFRNVQKRTTPLPWMRKLNELWNDKTLPTQISGFIVVVTTILMLVAITNGVVVALETGRSMIEKTFEENEKRKEEKKKGEEEKEEKKDEQDGDGKPPEPAPREPAAPTPTPLPRPHEHTPTYAEACGPLRPGIPAPEPQRSLLSALWLGAPGIAGAGAAVAGCAQPAQAVNGYPDVWWALGTCGSETRSIGIAAPGSSPALLLQQAARYAHARALDGTLRGATPRVRVGAGDLHLIGSDSGTHVLIRSESSAGRSGLAPEGPGCAGLSDENVRYTVLRPALAALWMVLIRERWAWPSAAEVGPEGESSYSFRANDEVVARGQCGPDGSCELRWDGRRLQGASGTQLSLAEVLAHAPPAVSP